VLALTGVASAGSSPGLLLGGGWAGATPAAGTVDFVTIRVSRNGNTLHFYGDWPASCSSGRFVTASVDRVVALRPDGSFAGSGSFRKEGTVGDFRFAGSLDTPTSADGTGGAQFRAGNETCATGAIAWRAVAPPPVSGAPRPLAGLYLGNTGQNDPVVLRVAAGGRRIVQAGLEFVVTCPGQPFGSGSVVFPGLPIRADGTFSSTRRFGSRLIATLTGRFGASTGGGTLAVRLRGGCTTRTPYAIGR
jgi:hypothetical protein